MKAAIVTTQGQTPVYGTFKDPVASGNDSLILVRASALSSLAKMRASGTHYSITNTFPFVPGVDGVGRLEDGKRVYFLLSTAPFGGMAERTLAPKQNYIELPDQLEDVDAAALANPGMSSWAALSERAKIKPGETVLINGATGSAGLMAVQICKFLGAGRIIVTGRNKLQLEELMKIVAAQSISLEQDETDLKASFHQLFKNHQIDIVLDYLWGPSAEKILNAGSKNGREGVPIRFVQIGTASGADITLPGSILRSMTIGLMGSGIGSVSFDRLMNSIDAMFRAAVSAGFKVAMQKVPLSAVTDVWNSKESGRIVFTTT